ncbi:hypothetical protein PR202_ga21261 [Eleusine coracana subsp. coracana]|uniref:Uncharacterized protein n=1 Tax=Eleusine coracana subsp. coracana TaxID=191504 RepID=A0AAV5D0D4_ELECO|nr:hypothetical protein PR202_ga21261 [Eleusine coracana subsp. coracana]
MGAASYGMGAPCGYAVAEGDASIEEGGEWTTMQILTTTDSRPTAPGNSPGIGHPGNNPGGERTTMQVTTTTDSRPTAPGNSPGIGHPGNSPVVLTQAREEGRPMK